jgi:hypothetical protein
VVVVVVVAEVGVEGAVATGEGEAVAGGMEAGDMAVVVVIDGNLLVPALRSGYECRLFAAFNT